MRCLFVRFLLLCLSLEFAFLAYYSSVVCLQTPQLMPMPTALTDTVSRIRFQCFCFLSGGFYAFAFCSCFVEKFRIELYCFLK